MTKAEYVRLSPLEKQYGDKHLLHAQLEVLNLIKSFGKYKALRQEELVLKITLKNIVEQTLNEIIKLERALPAAHYDEHEKKEDHKKEKEEDRRKLTLQEEIARVRAKLAQLNASSY